MTRTPIVAGQFYPAGKAELEAELSKSFTHKFGPGAMPGKRGAKKIYGAIAPHAGYFFSGAGAAWVYKEIAEAEFPDVYIILGVNHSGPVTCSSDDDWETPLGTVKCDKELIKSLAEKGIPVKNEAHHGEHSIEVQLPFLQTVSKDKADTLMIAPIMIADQRFDKWGRAIKEALEETKRTAVIICSSDFTHYGYNYDYVPFEKDVKKNMEKLDRDAIAFITKPNPKSFLDYTEKTGATICGRQGICTLLWLMKQLDKERKGDLLRYYTSGDVVGDYSNAVGYGAIVFK
ncbi:AmmeMemoRadiSam system protein B [Candidatus Woesearchaeota archaeon]|nr:AmmeMemoRadiSam system protein B [Candidatus Woesearchaeota archaeon]